MPKWVLRHVDSIFADKDQSKSHHLYFATKSKKQIVKNKGYFDENILCEDCDGQLGKYEDKLKEFIEDGKYDYKPVKLALLGILWKAHLSSLQVFQDINLSTFANEIHKILLNGHCDVLEFPVMVSKIQIKGFGIRSDFSKYMVILPKPIRTERGYKGYDFQISDHWFKIIVDGRKLSKETERCIMNDTVANITTDIWQTLC